MSRPLALVLGREAEPLVGSRLAACFSLSRFKGSPLGLAAELVRRSVHIVHLDGSAAHVAAAKLCGARVVYHPGASAPRWALKLADVLVVQTDAQRRTLEAKLPGQCIAVVPPGIDAAPYLKYNRRAPVPGTPLKLLHLGELAAPLEVLARLRARRVKVLLTIAGGGPGFSPLRARAQALGLADEVTFAAPAWGEYKAKLLRDADVLLVGEDGREALEAMAAGVVPVEAQRRPDAAVSTVAGLHSDRARLARMSHACRQRILADHSLERLADDFSAIYSLLLPWPASQAG